mgnify:CR=1 FL=1
MALKTGLQTREMEIGSRLFELKDGHIISGMEIANAYYIIKGKDMEMNDGYIFSNFVQFECEGIIKEFKRPTIPELLENGEYIRAIKLYRDTMGTGLKASKEAVNKIREEMKADGRTSY